MATFDIRYVAGLARLQLTAEEEARLGTQLASILGYVEQLKEVDVSAVDPTAHAFPLTNVTRPDMTRPGMSPDEALASAPRRIDALFGVPKIVE